MPEYYTQDFTDLRLPGQPDPVDVDKCIPRFFLQDSLRKNDKGEEEIFKVEMVEIITPGDRLARPVQKVKDDHRKRWQRAYAAFRSGVEPSVQGTPIATWDEIGWQMQIDMRAAGFQTIEQLAGAHDGQMAEIPNGTLLRKKAQAYVERNKSIVNKDGEIDALRKQLADLTALVKGTARVLPQSAKGDAGNSVRKNSVDKTRRGPGRPRKADPVAEVSGDASASDAAA